MDKPRFTPGPWKIRRLHGVDAPFVAIDAPTHASLARVVWQMEEDRHHGRSSPQQEANARLIAASPQLAEALAEAPPPPVEATADEARMWLLEYAAWHAGVARAALAAASEEA